jgi:hypothetical protein
VAAGRWDRSRDDRDQSADRDPRSARSRWTPPSDSSVSGDEWAGDGAPATPETGRWSARQDRWIPQSRASDDTDYRIKRFVDDTGDMAIAPEKPGQGQILDHDEFWGGRPTVYSSSTTRRTGPPPAQPDNPYWGAPTPSSEPEEPPIGYPYWGAPQPAPPRPPKFTRPQRPPTSAPPISPLPPRSVPPMSAPPMSPPQPPPQRLPPRGRPMSPPGQPMSPLPRSVPPSPPSGFDAYRRAGAQTDWRTSARRDRRTGSQSGWRTGEQGRPDDPFSGIRDDYADWNEDPDDDEGEAPGPTNYVAAALAALGWFIIPVAVYLGYVFFLDDQPPPGCDGAGTPECLTPRAEALQNLFGNVPLVTITVSVSILIALVLRRVASGWRTLTIGFASAVVGAGAATVLFTVVSG